MKRKKRPASQSEAMKLRWKKRIVFEKGYTEQCAEWMAERLEALTDHLQYGARSYCLSEAERRLQAGEGDTDLLRSGIPQEV